MLTWRKTHQKERLLSVGLNGEVWLSSGGAVYETSGDAWTDRILVPGNTGRSM